MAPYAPGGNIDVTARIIADKLREVLGVTVLVENKAGASGMIGGDVIARSAPDGYNLLVSANSLVDVPVIYGNAPYDWKTAFQPISHIQAVPAVLVVNPSSPIRTLADFVKIGRETPGKLAIANSGVGTTNHIVIELLGDATGAKYTLVHYKGSGAGRRSTSSPARCRCRSTSSTAPSATSRRASCAQSPSPPTSACRNFPTCRLLRSPASRSWATSRTAPTRACSARPRCRPRCWPS